MRCSVHHFSDQRRCKNAATHRVLLQCGGGPSPGTLGAAVCHPHAEAALLACPSLPLKLVNLRGQEA